MVESEHPAVRIRVKAWVGDRVSGLDGWNDGDSERVGEGDAVSVSEDEEGKKGKAEGKSWFGHLIIDKDYVGGIYNMYFNEVDRFN